MFPVARALGAIASPLRSLPSPMGFASVLLQQVRHRKAFIKWRWPHKGLNHAGKGNAVWWQPLLPALAAEKCGWVKGQSNRDTKQNQMRMQQRLWDHAKRKEMTRRRAIFNELKLDARRDQIKSTYAEYADFLREHPQGFTPSPSRREQKLRAAAASAAEASAPTSE